MLRKGYEVWWNLVSEQFERDIPIALGRDDDPVKLTTHDLRNEDCAVAWNQRQVRQGLAVSGHWEIEVKRAGTYSLRLRRWPEEAGYAIAGGIEGEDIKWRKDAIKRSDAPHYSGGVALPIRWARIAIAGQNLYTEVEPTDVYAEFAVSLERGTDRLFAAFYDTAERTIAPYYLYVTMLA